MPAPFTATTAWVPPASIASIVTKLIKLTFSARMSSAAAGISSVTTASFFIQATIAREVPQRIAVSFAPERAESPERISAKYPAL